MQVDFMIKIARYVRLKNVSISEILCSTQMLSKTVIGFPL